MLIDDTIVARATPPGLGGVALVRLSGTRALEITRVMTQKTSFQPRLATLSTLWGKDGEKVDEGLVCVFEAPHSYTGEDVVEISLHGSDVLVGLIVEACLANGARMANPGEFTERAFHHGKIDLMQASAVCDLIHARSALAARAALQSLQGRFSEQVQLLQKQLMNLRMYVESSIDFSEEEVDLLSDQAFLGHLNLLDETLDVILNQAQSGYVLNQGLRLAIIGPTNVGKSSLMNWLTQMDTSIVTDIAGTTRDVVKEQVILNGIPITLVDTAGLRQSSDVVEQHGMARVAQEINQADVIWLVLDCSRHQPDEAVTFWTTHLSDIPFPKERVTLIMNKVDLVQQLDDVICISAKHNIGKQALLTTLMPEDKALGADAISVRASQLDALRRVKASVNDAKLTINGHQLDLAAEELKVAQDALSELTGEVTQEDVLSAIFSTFCIGK